MDLCAVTFEESNDKSGREEIGYNLPSVSDVKQSEISHTEKKIKRERRTVLQSFTRAPVAQWIEHPPSKRTVAGSNPAGREL